MPNWFNKKSMPLETKGKSFPLLAMKWKLKSIAERILKTNIKRT